MGGVVRQLSIAIDANVPQENRYTRGKLPKDLTGYRFGKLLVKNQGEWKTYSLRRRKTWDCICECGNSVNVVECELKKSVIRYNTTSCGCAAYKSSLGIFGELFRLCKKNAIYRGKTFKITKEEWFPLTQKHCFYCGRPPELKSIGHDRYIHANGLDCIDPSDDVGYVVSNLVTACSQCNYSKLDWSPEEYINHCVDVVLHHPDMIVQVLRTAISRGILPLLREILPTESWYAKPA